MSRFRFLQTIPRSPLIGLDVGRSVLYALLGLFILFLGYFVGQLPLMAYVANQVEDMDAFQTLLGDFAQSNDFSVLGLSRNQGFAFLLMSFAGTALFFLPFFSWVYRVPMRRLWTVYSRLRWSRLLWGFGVIGVMTGLLELVSYTMNPEIYEWTFKAETFPLLLLLSLTLLPIQTSMEEIALRGFLLPHVAHWVRKAWIAVLITSVAFAMMHMGNPEIKEYGMGKMMMYYSLSGVFLGVMTLLDDGLEMALGVHFGINLYSATVVSYQGAVIQTDTLFEVTYVDMGSALIVFLVMASIFLWLSGKVFGWSWKGIFEHKMNYNDEGIERV